MPYQSGRIQALSRKSDEDGLGAHYKSQYPILNIDGNKVYLELGKMGEKILRDFN